MTAALGTRCPSLGCLRNRHVSRAGIHYGHCLAHSRELMSRAFAIQQGARAAVASPGLNGPGFLLTGELSATAGTRTGR